MQIIEKDAQLEFTALLFAEGSTVDDTCDSLFAQNSTTFLIGNSSANTLIGTSGADIMDGMGGNDIICGFGGDDTINGGTGNDIIIGGIGSDIIVGGDGTDACDGTTNDTSITECEIQLPEGFTIEDTTIGHLDTFDEVDVAMAALQITLDSHVIIHDEINRISSSAPITGTGTYLLQAICHIDNESKFMGSELAIVTNGTDTISNDSSLNVGTLDVDVTFTEITRGIKMDVINTNDLPNVTAEIHVTCADFTN